MKQTTLILVLALIASLRAADILTGAGDATFYYDINGGGTCGPANGIDSFPETEGFPMCEGSNPNPHKLIDYGTNNIVAMPNQLLGPNLANYCGKKVIPIINGQEMDLGLFIWDGCEACNANDGLDFSSTVFAQLFGDGRCGEGRISGELSWRITDEQVIPFDTNAGGGTTATLPVTTDPPASTPAPAGLAIGATTEPIDKWIDEEFWGNEEIEAEEFCEEWGFEEEQIWII